MRTMTLTLDKDWKSAMRQAGEEFKKAWKTGHYQGESIGFSTPVVLFNSLTPKRWEILSALQGMDRPVTLPELADFLASDIECVETDVQALLDLGLLERIDHGHIFCPFDVIRAEFALKRVA